MADTAAADTFWSRLRRRTLWFLFAAVLLIPKTLALRRTPRMWNAIRIGVGLAGAAIAAAGWAWARDGHERLWTTTVGLTFALLALVILPERPRLSVDARTRELGALVVVKGGRYRPAGGAWTDTLLFVGPRRLSVLDTSLRPLLEVQLAEVTLLRAEPAEQGWLLHLAVTNSVAEFFYRGPFAEHFARVAESTVRSQLPNPLPIVR